MGITRCNRVSNEVVMRRCGQESVEVLLRIYRLRWLGHVGRMDDDRLPKHMLFGKMAGKVPVGRQRTKWQTVAAEDLRHTTLGYKSWFVKCQTRTLWNGLVNDLKMRRS